MLLNICVALLTLSQGMILYLLLGLLPAISSGSRGSFVDDKSIARLSEQASAAVHQGQASDANENHVSDVENTCSPVLPVLALEPVTVYPLFKALDTSVVTTLERAPPQIQMLDIETFLFVV